MAIEIVKHSYEREAFLKVPDDELQMFLILGRLLNELSVLTRYIAWTSQYPHAEFQDGPYEDAGFVQKMTVLYILIGKLHSSWEALNKRFLKQKYSRDYITAMERGNVAAHTALENLKSYFADKDSLLTVVRHNAAFHNYDQKNIALEGFRSHDFGEIEIYLCDESIGNCLFYAADMNATISILKTIDENIETAFKMLGDESTGVQINFARVFYAIFSIFKMRHLNHAHKEKNISVDSPVKWSEIFLPYFINPDITQK